MSVLTYFHTNAAALCWIWSNIELIFVRVAAAAAGGQKTASGLASKEQLWVALNANMIR